MRGRYAGVTATILSTRPPVPGDTVVHLDYGLCRLGEARRVELSSGTLHTIELSFRGGETMHVPVSDAVRIWNYGADVPDNGLSEIGNESWAQDQAERMVEITASVRAMIARKRKRAQRTGAEIRVTDHRLSRAGKGFAHELTDCQSRALSEIVDDLRSERPMNRVLAGDVGCGKTEVAVRAVLASALAGKRVRFIAPTRVLARQHFEDMVERAETLSLSIALYSGDQTEAERTAIIDAKPDILVGTQGLLGKAFRKQRFGLTVLDEEQKFGATAKRQKGAKRATMSNILRLSATPIPRTIAEAKVGLSDLSVIANYPGGRGKTVTRSVGNDETTIREAIDAELSREGQVIVLCARISELNRTRKRIKALYPDHKVGRVHGDRRAKENRRAIARFTAGERSIICATAMLETGINIPTANTMLVFEPDRFGLAQLHQLRGRIGRGSRDGRFILVAPDNPTEDYARRVSILEELQQRGDGLRLSVADAVLRGMGSLDAEEQTGHACAIGTELYEYLLDRASESDGSAELFNLVPKLVGEMDCGAGEVSVSEIIAHSRLALREPDTVLADPPDGCTALIAKCVQHGAVRVAMTGEGAAFVMQNGDIITEHALAAD